MKRLTWALWSLMLFLGLGTAFADVEKPVITPATGSAVTIGDMVTITCETPGATIHYTAVNSWVSTTDPVYTAPFALTEDMIKTSGLYKDEIVIRAFAVLDGVESDPTFVRYSNISTGGEPEGVAQPVITPATGSAVTIGDKVTITCATSGATIHYTTVNGWVSTADPIYTAPFTLTEDMIKTSGMYEGEIVIRAFAVLDGVESDPAFVRYSNITIPEPDPEEVAQPVITPAKGSTVHIGDKVTITCATPGATIRYTTTNTYVSEFTDPEYTEPFELTEAMIKKTGTYEGKIVVYAMAYKGDKESTKAMAIYEVATDPEPVEPPAAPTFANVGEVMQGDALEIEWPDDLDLSKYLDQAIILYVENDNTTELEYDGTLGELQALAMGGGGISPWAKAGEPAFKLAVYDGEIEAWNPAVALSAVGTVNVRARMAVGSDYDEAPLYSDEFSATYTVTARPAPNAPVFLVNGEALEGASVALEENAKAEVSWSGYPDESQEHIVVYTTDGSESVFEAENMMDEIMEDANIWYFGDEAIEVSAPATIKAAVAEVSATFGITWSEVVTVAFMVAGDEPDDPEKPALPETVTAPTFVPAAGEVEKGQAIDWTWDEAYNEYEIKGVVYVANGKDEDLNIDGAKYYELLAAWEDEDENTVREDGVVYLYLGEAEGEVYPYKVEKNVTVKARLVVGAMKEMAEGEEGEEPELELVLSPVVTAAYTVKGETPVVETVAAPTFSVAAGEVEKGTKVTIACTTEGATIYYTIDGTEPTAESIEYKAAIEINTDVTLKAIAVKGDAKSEVATAAYTVKVANENLELAGVSVYPNPSNGVFNIELPVAATVEVFMSNGMLYQRLALSEGKGTLNITRSGIYFLRITGEGRTVIKRIIVR